MTESISLEINTPAPNFEIQDIFDRKINLRDYRGKRLLIAFFRHAGCPFCNIRVHRLQKKLEEFKAKNLEMIFFFESEKSVLLGNRFHKGVSPIPLISDPEKIWYNKYGIENSARKSAVSHITSLLQNVVVAKLNGLPVHMMAGKESINTIPAEFLVNETGIVKKVHYARGLTDQMSMEALNEFAES